LVVLALQLPLSITQCGIAFASPHQTLVLVTTPNLSQAAITIANSSLDWVPYTGNYDYSGDQQTGQASAEIVGSGTDYGFYVLFDNNGSSLSTDGELAFRIRFDAPGDKSDPANFENVVWIGIDADLSGTIDVFLGLSDSGNRQFPVASISLPPRRADPSPSTISPQCATWRRPRPRPTA
jgi:hypothetical protein